MKLLQIMLPEYINAHYLKKARIKKSSKTQEILNDLVRLLEVEAKAAIERDKNSKDFLE